MTSLSITDLIRGVQYKIYSHGGCKEMETTVYRVFYGINSDGNALFYDNIMECPVSYGSPWSFYRV
jgi:hypothetical protein